MFIGLSTDIEEIPNQLLDDKGLTKYTFGQILTIQIISMLAGTGLTSSQRDGICRSHRLKIRSRSPMCHSLLTPHNIQW
jgi:hypothetical protein